MQSEFNLMAKEIGEKLCFIVSKKVLPELQKLNHEPGVERPFKPGKHHTGGV